MDTQSAEIARSYDQVPYTSRPFPQSQPPRLAALATLFGLSPPDVSQARVLEIGCAAGGNIIPLAAAFPDAEILGLDLSSAQVGAGQARIRALGLKNIRLITTSVADVTRGLGTFDYIVCHGVYSWVPAAIRDAILRVTSENLSADGIGYISYNVYPGWRLRTVLRDAMMFHGSTGTTPAERLQLGREFLNQLGNLTNANQPYGQMLRHEARVMAQHEDYYVTHEYLETHNEPCYVSEFFDKLNMFGLTYLTEADIHLTIAEAFGVEIGALLRTLSGNRLDRLEQYVDYLTGRTFRQSLVVKAEQSPKIERTITTAYLNKLHITTRVGAEPAQRDDGVLVFEDAAGRTLTTKSPAVAKAISTLARSYPATATLDELLAEAETAGADNQSGAVDVPKALLAMILSGLAQISTRRVSTPPEIAAFPSADALPRGDARAGMTWTTNAHHETVALDVVQRALLPILDGSLDQEALTKAVAGMAAGGQLAFERDGKRLEEPDHIIEAAGQHVARALNALHRLGLMTAPQHPASAAP